MRERMVLTTPRDLLRLRVDRHESTATKRPDVRLARVIERHIPSKDGARPIPKSARERRAPLCPGGCVRRIGDVRTAFRPGHVLLRMRDMNERHGRWLT